jgi:hypothetical protein
MHGTVGRRIMVFDILFRQISNTVILYDDVLMMMMMMNNPNAIGVLGHTN